MRRFHGSKKECMKEEENKRKTEKRAKHEVKTGAVITNKKR